MTNNKSQISTIILIAFFVGAAGSIILGRFIFPTLATVRGLSWVNNLVTNAPIVVNRREEVQFTEGVDLSDLVKQAGNITVSVYAKNEPSFLGNGIVVTADGLIFTTTEVIGSQTQVRIILNDGTVLLALVRATDPKSNLAILTTEARNLSTAQFDRAADLIPGQRIVALGQSNSPFVRSFDTGYVTSSVANSASPVKIFSSESFGQTIGTNIGFRKDLFGGPVINLNGRVVGIMSAGQILLAEQIQTAMSSYLNLGKITRPIFGITYYHLSSPLALIKGLSKPGALVATVNHNTPAEKAGLRTGDLILEIDGQDLSKTSLEQFLNQRAAGEVKLKVLRGSQEIILSAVLVEK